MYRGNAPLFALIASAVGALGCGSSDPAATLAGLGGAATSGGMPASGGSVAQGGALSTGGNIAKGGTQTTNGSGGTTASGNGGNAPTTGGTSPTTGGNASTGGVTGVGGNPAGGNATGGTSLSTGGSKATGGSVATGGAKATGGVSATGGTSSTGGVAATGGAKATGGSNATGGASGYAPCPTNGDPCKILPFGDSITNGVASTDLGGYRSQLFKLVVAASQKVMFTGSQSSGPATVSGVTFPKNHEGRSGWTIDPGYSTYGAGGISTLVPSPAFTTVPNIVLLMIGTNDVTYTSGQSTMTNRLEALLDKIIAAAPNALIVLAKLTPLSWGPAALTDYNAKLPGIVAARAAKGQHIVGVDMSQMPLAGLATDNVHPNDQGYTFMAGVWYAAIKDLLPK